MGHSCFVTCTPGLEEVLEREIVALGYQPSRGKGGVYVAVSALRDAMVMNLQLRTASRVLWPLLVIQQPSKQRLYRAITDYDWRPYFDGFPTMSIDVPYASHPDYSNTLYVAQLAKDAICDQLRQATGRRPSVDTKSPQVQFSLAVNEEQASLSFDTSLDPLFKRGYRPEAVMAPLKETLAAAILFLSGYRPESICFDPCCGGGTFLIEAGLMATNTAPGLLRERFGFFRHPDFQEEEWRQLRKEAFEAVVPFPQNRLFGCERDSKSYRLLLRSIARAGLMGLIDVHCGDFRDLSLTHRPTFVVSNPPFGVRLGEAKRWEPLYRALGDLLKRGTDKPAIGAILTASADLAKAIGLKAQRKIPIFHGGLDCILYLYELSPRST
jgi:putative N6-adenine-specific DNA methylase